MKWFELRVIESNILKYFALAHSFYWRKEVPEYAETG